MRKSEWIAGLAYLAVLAALPFVGHWARHDDGPACAYDGSPIEPAYRVRIVDGHGRDVAFCCIRCAEHWLQSARGAVQSIHVTDERSGEEIDAATAHFVRSLVVTSRTTGNRIHAFRTRTDAEEHARTSSGYLLEDAERPFPRERQ